MQTFTAIINQRIFTGWTVMPGLIAVTGFHGREDMHQTGMAAALFQDRLNTVFLTEIFDFANKLYFDSVLRGHTLGIGTDFLSKRLSRSLPIGTKHNVRLSFGRRRILHISEAGAQM
jgi:hypothetical protein